MKNSIDFFRKTKSIKRRNSILSLASLILLLLGSTSLHAQSESKPVLFESGLTYLYILLTIVVGTIIYVVYDAKRVLQRNGKSLDMPLPSFRWMASHGKFVGIFFLIIILLAIVWAISY